MQPPISENQPNFDDQSADEHKKKTVNTVEAEAGKAPEDGVMHAVEEEADAKHETQESAEDKPRKKKKKSKKSKGKILVEEVGSKRGVETMFRNVFRSELDLITLAATKANIMISLNGFIVSALMISGAFIYASSPIFLVPAMVFMLTATGSIVFALISASPERSDMLRNAWWWFRDLLRKKASLSDFRTRVWHRKENFVGDQVNILIYEDRVKLSKEDYWEEMQKIINNREQVYEKMSDLLYWIGVIADRKFKYLNISYKIFRWGLLASMLSFVGVKLIPTEWMPALTSPVQNASAQSQEQEGEEVAPVSPLTAEQKQQFNINQLGTTYEPSAVQQLPDGRLLVAEDEYLNAMSLLTIDDNGQLVESEAIDSRLVRSLKNKMNDLEGLALDDEGFVYAITSHSPNKKGERKEDREQLIRFKVQGNQAQGLDFYFDLVNQLQHSEPLKQMLKDKLGKEVDFAEINIEGLTYDRKNHRLLLGFRDPDLDKRSIILAISNPKQLFTEKAEPIFSDVFVLDLKGRGIRSLTYDAHHDTYWITNEVGDKGSKKSQLWVWQGVADSQPKEVTVPGIELMTNVEAIDVVEHQGQVQMVLMSDEGDATKQLGGRVMWVKNLKELLESAK